jgi:hypothetical protein
MSGGELLQAEAEMAQIIAVVSLGFLLTATALVWKSWEPGTGVNAVANTTSLSIRKFILRLPHTI